MVGLHRFLKESNTNAGLYESLIVSKMVKMGVHMYVMIDETIILTHTNDMYIYVD
jgi:hypothetical protein